MKAVAIGVGCMGRRHVHALRKIGCSFKLAAGEHKLEAGQLFGNLEVLFTQCRPDVVVIATNADTHCELTCHAAARGAKFILVEKSMAVSVAQYCELPTTRYGMPCISKRNRGLALRLGALFHGLV